MQSGADVRKILPQAVDMLAAVRSPKSRCQFSRLVLDIPNRGLVGSSVRASAHPTIAKHEELWGERVCTRTVKEELQ